MECLRGRETASKDRGSLGRRRRPGPARPPPGRLAARHSSGHPAVPYIPDSNKQNSVLMYYAAGILVSSETAGQGLVGAVFLLPRSLLAVSLTRKHSVAPPTPRFSYDNIASFGVYPELPASFGIYLTRCSRAKMYQAPTPLFSVGSKVIRNTLCARRRGSLGTRLVTLVQATMKPQHNECTACCGRGCYVLPLSTDRGDLWRIPCSAGMRDREVA